MTEPPFFWRGCDAIADFIEWQEAEQSARDQALIAAATCPVVDDTGDE
jgi:predicted transcriptional regulator